MAQPDDPERLLSEALRAQAASTPHSGSSGLPTASGWPVITQTGPGTEVREAPTAPVARPPLRPLMLILLAVLLGLAVGTVAGVLSVI